MTQEELGEFLFKRACQILNIQGFVFKGMGRKAPVKSLKKSFRISYINLKAKKVVLDLYTPRKRSLSKPSVIIRIVAHELAHFQKPPYLQLWRGRRITRSHYPGFYRRVNKNIRFFKKDKVLGSFLN